MKYDESEFYCIKCGNRGIPLPRPHGHQRKQFHRKKLYCIHCKQEVNHIECKTEADINDFKIEFKNGMFIDEAIESVSYIQSIK